MKKKVTQQEKMYYLGLDIGTDSVGWAVTDENYKLLRANNKSLWGVRLFDEAQPAVNRRGNRAARRRLERRKRRIILLREIFAPLINALDDNFFNRLDDSNLYGGDKREKTKFSLFSDKDFSDKDFHKKYPTIYHLRRDMMTEKDPDPRLVYLALHHMVKYRGHFLLEGENSSVIDNIAEPLNAINGYLDEKELPVLDMSKLEDFRRALIEKASKTKRFERYKNIFGVTDKRVSDLLRLIAGCSVKAKNIWDVESDESVTFDCDWESKQAEYEELLGDDYSLMENAKVLYDYAKLKSVLGDHKYICEGMAEKFDKHKADLETLKKVIKQYFGDSKYDVEYTDKNKVTHTVSAYDAMFKVIVNKNVNYSAYSGKTNFGKKDKNGNKPDLIIEKSNSATYEDFTKYVVSVLKKSDEAMADERVKRILTDIDNGTFMPKQVSKNNATLPYQLNLAEMDAILDNVSQYSRYAFLNEPDADGFTPKQKIRSLLTFRMPYYVGPTNNTSGKYWIIRRQDGKILPWNYAQKIDLHATEQAFIEKLTNYCTYIPGAKVLPKCSLLYEEYAFLNIVNTITVNGERLPSDAKNKLSQYYAQTGESKLSVKKLTKWLSQNNYINGDDPVIEGFDNEAAVHRRMYYQFTKIFGSAEEAELHRDDIEDIIYYATVAGPEKNNLVKYIKSHYKYLDEAQVNKIKGMTCKGWGRFSKELLTNRYGMNPQTGELGTISIMDVMRYESLNFQEVYNHEVYGFKKAIDGFQCVFDDKITYDIVDELYCSPSVKKQIWQSLCVVRELTDILGCAPTKIFVEVARKQKAPKEERKRTQSRYDTLSAALESLKKDKESMFDSDVYDEFKNSKPEKLQNKKLFLYFMQNGLDAYTGERIDCNNLALYDIDHIYPRSKIKDDSLHNNLVLTHHSNNVAKADRLVNPAIQAKMEKYWRVWKKQKLITDEKYSRLTRTTELTDDETADFINRQLVETQQSTKEVTRLLSRLFPESEVVWSKAGNVSDFRARPKQVGDSRVPSFVKCRELNDLHHVKDAYLNIVVGNVFNVCYGHNAKYWMKQNPLGKLTPVAKIYDRDIKNNSVTAWIAGKDGTIAQVEKTMRSNAVLFTRESKVTKGALFNATLQRKNGDTSVLIPLKGATNGNHKYRCMFDITKYGGYISEMRSYYMLVKFTERKVTKKAATDKVFYKLLGVTAKDAPALITNEARIKYCERNGLATPKILIPKIKVKTMFDFEGTRLFLSGYDSINTISWMLATQNTVDESVEQYCKKIYNLLEKVKNNSDYAVTYHDEITAEENIRLYDLLLQKMQEDKYRKANLAKLSCALDNQDARTKFYSKDLIGQCRIISEIIKVFQCKAMNGDLSDLGQSKSCGRIRFNCVFDSLEGISIIHRSITGVFEQKIPLTYFDKKEKTL